MVETVIQFPPFLHPHLNQGTNLNMLYLLSELSKLVKVTRPFLKCISKAKAAKLVRDLVDLFLEIDVESNNAAVSEEFYS